MYLGVGVVIAMILVLLSPALWLAWWLVAGVGERASWTPGHHRPA